MNRLLRNGLVLAVVHLAVVGSLGVKLLADRATRPRVWVKTAPVDPEAPIRGRYVRLVVEVDRIEGEQPKDGVRFSWSGLGRLEPVALSVRDGRLVGARSNDESGLFVARVRQDNREVLRLDPPLALFIPEHVVDPSVRPAGEELWVEVTVPRRGAPRPIRLGVKRDGALTPLDLR